MQVHVGDQANATFLQSLVQATPGGFDIIIDDGGHTMDQQLTRRALSACVCVLMWAAWMLCVWPTVVVPGFHAWV